MKKEETEAMKKEEEETEKLQPHQGPQKGQQMETRDVADAEAEDLRAVLDVLREIQRCTGVDIVPSLRSRPKTPQNSSTQVSTGTQVQTIQETSAPGSDKPGPLRPEEERSTSVRVEKMERLLGKMLENQLQESARRKRALKARRRRERKRLEKAASFKQQPLEFPSALPYGLAQTVGTVDIPPTAAVPGTLLQEEERMPLEKVEPEERQSETDEEELSEAEAGVGRMYPQQRWSRPTQGGRYRHSQNLKSGGIAFLRSRCHRKRNPHG
jgi:hypothetical protein